MCCKRARLNAWAVIRSFLWQCASGGYQPQQGLEAPAPVAAISQRKQESSAPPAPAQPIRPVYTDAHHQPDKTLSKHDRIGAAILACNGAMAGSRGVAAMLGLKRTTQLSRMQRMGIDIKDVLETRGQSLPA